MTQARSPWRRAWPGVIMAAAMGAGCSSLAPGGDSLAQTPPGQAPSQTSGNTARAAVPAGSPTNAAPACRPDPLQGRPLYLRGSFNGWAANDNQRFAWACTGFELVTRLQGEHRFKLGDEAWSADADFGRRADAPENIAQAQPDAAWGLAAKGGEFTRRFNAGVTYRFRLDMSDQRDPKLSIETCPLAAPPLGETTLYLRGTMNNWAALDESAFRFSCDAYYLNLTLTGRHEFKIADAGWAEKSSFGLGSGSYLAEGGGNVERWFNGEHTLRLAWAGGRPELSIGPRTFADPTAKTITDPIALSLRFDSRHAQLKQPFGAVLAGSAVSFSLDAAAGVQALTMVVERRRLEGNQEVLAYEPLARVPMAKTRQADGSERWQATHRFADIGIYGYWFEAQIGGQKFAYQNNRASIYWTREKGAGGLGEVDELPANLGGIRRFRQTVYAADFSVPDWAQDIVYYYIFPERFRNGDKANDPQVGRDRYKTHGIERHKSWNERPYRPGSGDGSDTVHNNDFFGGDLAGIIEKLDHIRELGANTIYMTPIFQAPSNHKYDTADFTKIDPAFGDEATFRRLTSEAHKRGIRIILDTSLNHVGSDSIYFDRYGNFGNRGAFSGSKVQPSSPWAKWFSFDTTQSNPDKQFKGWVGITDLPELDKSNPEYRAFAFGNADSVMKRWLDAGADGWRMDVAPFVPDDFWRAWRKAIRAHKPDAFTVAETWFDSSKFFLGDMFDSTMNYIFRNAVMAYAAGGSAKELVQNLELMREAYPPQAHHALMNLLSSHDAPRALHVYGHTAENRDAAVKALAQQRLLLSVFLQMTYPGAPTVYYGDEVGVTGGEDPFNRATFPWADEGGQPDGALHAQFKRLIAMRRTHPILRRGELFAPLYVDDHVVVMLRRLGQQWALVAINNSAQARTLSLPLPAGSPALGWGVLDPLAPASAAPTSIAAQDGALRLDVPPLFGRVWLVGR
jgi:cyclomaltodextrinase / maltogenic alpha-amylase / neopullulanase